MDPELVLASSPSDAGIVCWDVLSGAELHRFRTCASPSHGLNFVGCRFIACSQVRDSSSSSGSVFYWSSNKPQVEVKSFPSEPIKPIISHREGTYIVGGGVSGYIYFWEVATGILLKKWQGHYRAVSRLVFSDDQSLLISGAEDGSIRVWSLLAMFDDTQKEQGKNLYEYSFYDHSLAITDIVVGHGGCNSIIVSASEDKTCKVWSLFNGKLLRDIIFPSVINAVVMDPWEHVFYAGSKDGMIYIAALNAPDTNSSHGKNIIDSTFFHSEAVTCLKLASNGNLLVSGSMDGMVRIWDTKTRMIVRTLKLCKGSPVNNILVVRQSQFLRPHGLSYSQSSSIVKHKSSLPPPLEKYSNSSNEVGEVITYLTGNEPQPRRFPYISGRILTKYMKELQQQGSAAASEMEVEGLKLDYEKSKQMVQKQKKMYEDLYEFCANEVLNRDQAGNCNGST
ncbi:protein ROOT INITIATION DEFECTIVE 3-like [Impatiens glandulifera]|uniref:protein ROOT INITIATION DEFECTIVE 3-like n=1 Tax=Impatiens glandulifera TaxID=253017 RepID=UPI001FB1001A|nr:protein ROOT INITIATION DEFECTIVE 3-like [Impatiens glandulifera]